MIVSSLPALGATSGADAAASLARRRSKRVVSTLSNEVNKKEVSQ